MTVEVRITSSDDLRVIGNRLGDLRETLNTIGAFLTARSRASFREQRLGNSVWAPRMNPNVPGIVKDLNAGGFPKARRFVDRPALVDTGQLRNSITWAVAPDGRSVTVGSQLSYAATQNEGGPSDVTLTPGGRRQLSMWLRADPSRREFGLGWLFRQPTFTVQVRERRFLDVRPGDLRELVELVEKRLGRKVRIRRGG